jgi:diguanylate cyclase (GGDEF)-like protein/PAS domain S-box-containing protein
VAAVAAVAAGAGAPAATAGDDELLRHALAVTTSGVTISDLRLPDQPLVYVNAAFEHLAGLPRDEVLGRNCRFLQGPDSDPAAIARIRDAIARGVECRETVLNHRGPERTPWWNEVHLSPVHDADGVVVQYVGVQHDVTERVEAERALLRERDRTQSCLTRIQELAYTDPLTGLPNRRRLEEQVETAIWDARTGRDTLALLFVDLDGFKAVNDRLGHAAGDELLQSVARTLRGRLRRGDLLARLGGDEFLVALLGLDPATAGAEARRVADELARAVGAPVEVGGTTVTVGASVGVGVYPTGGEDFSALLHEADRNMYAVKPVRA